jgi:hypothetical protein
MKPSLHTQQVYLITDIGGKENATYARLFGQMLSPHQCLQVIDVCELAGIDVSLSESIKHRQFLDFGIHRAVESLKKYADPSAIFIGCSMGGLIIWKAALLCLDFKKFIAIASTRLRFETDHPQGEFKLYFGTLDPNNPDISWFSLLNDHSYQFLDGDHYIYTQPEIIRNICLELNQ